MDKLKQLLSLCKSGVFLSVNEHRDYYMTTEQRIKELREIVEQYEGDVDEELHHAPKMIETDTVIDLQFYPKNPVSSYSIYHYDLEMALDEALAILTTDMNKEG